MRHQHDAVASRDTEQRNEADHRCHTQHAAGEKHAGNAADERKRQVDHHHQGVARSAEGQYEHHEDAGNRGAAEDQQTLAGALLAFELSAILDPVALGHRHLLCHRRLQILDNTAEIASGHVGRHHDPALHVLTQDHVGAHLAPDVGDHSNGHGIAGRRVDREIGDPLEVGG